MRHEDAIKKLEEIAGTIVGYHVEIEAIGESRENRFARARQLRSELFKIDAALMLAQSKAQDALSLAEDLEDAIEERVQKYEKIKTQEISDD